MIFLNNHYQVNLKEGTTKKDYSKQIKLDQLTIFVKFQEEIPPILNSNQDSSNHYWNISSSKNKRPLNFNDQFLQSDNSISQDNTPTKLDTQILFSNDCSLVNRQIVCEEVKIQDCQIHNQAMEEINQKNQNKTKKQHLISTITNPLNQYSKYFTEEDDDYLLQLYELIDKNNVNKNILSSFQKYILEKGDNVVVECLDSKSKELKNIRKEFKNFTKSKNLNNNTIYSLFNSSRYSEQFEYYLKFYAMDYFHQSKVKDKESHFICVAFFLRCFSSSKLRERIVVYNKSKYFKSLHSNRFANK